MDILEVKNLTKKYGSYLAVDDISFNIEKGKVVGFLGPNGAGKTTTIQILCGITLPTNGSISYFGKDFFDTQNIVYSILILPQRSIRYKEE